tara:strand:+ start:2436 stop:2702 length:267 start_codon:yes stop_codon:yes gene_type:complete
LPKDQLVSLSFRAQKSSVDVLASLNIEKCLVLLSHPELAEGSVGLVKLPCSKSDIDVSASLNIEKCLVFPHSVVLMFVTKTNLLLENT